MPRPRPPHLHREITRHGNTVWYVRKGQGRRIRIRAAFGTPEFDSEYQAALAGNQRPAKAAPSAGSLTWLLARYRETTEWSGLSEATRRQRDNIFVHVIKAAGHQPLSKITKAQIIAGKERRAATPAQARNFLDAMRGLFRWAVKAEMVKTDPTAGVDNPPRKAGDGFPPWTEEHIAAYEARWPIGTRQRVWLDVLAFTGLRRGDAVRLGRPHVRDGIATIKTEKSGETVEVTLPILPVLRATLDTGPCGDLTFIAGANGRPLTKESFGNEFREACKAAGVPGSAHGVRKIAATRAANAGATVAQLEAIFGWTGGTMASLYTKKADRKRLATNAMHLLSNDAGTSIPAPGLPVRDKGRKG
ncbi:tyrosine-type recombinase/integrase [Starkeya sp. ORNL1]|uniref:tyrosine-type recombinase/integrase n=1 Tax=Starkeya sp. ORNL1 TaxID=2709380 RepID=UPI0014645A22|nr:tyrosine-type recombinase/integrase [Starkeya sp. ORNL1]QJP12963.1 tyrosine-type recombinase/integrase [Starkeya sp. ORNL1]